jgi:hypothetical protein
MKMLIYVEWDGGVGWAVGRFGLIFVGCVG